MMLKLKFFIISLFFVLIFSSAQICVAYEKIYKKTQVGDIKIKDIPQCRVIETGVEENYFDHSNALFRNLFKYISDNTIDMTVPVEANIEPSKMRFFISPSDKRSFTDTDKIKIKTIPAHTVASYGARGSYSKKNVTYAMNTLENWVNTQTAIRVKGRPYAVFWDGPFKLWFLKKFEIHIPVEKKSYR